MPLEWYALEIPATNRIARERRNVRLVAAEQQQSWSTNQRLAPPGSCRWPAARDRAAVWFAHCHSGSQSLRHLPWHSNSIMLPPHCGQTRLMIEEIMLALSSPGNVSIVLIFALLTLTALLLARGIPISSYSRRGRGPSMTILAASVSPFLSTPRWNWSGHLCRPPPRSLLDVATAMPNVKRETQLLKTGVCHVRSLQFLSVTKSRQLTC